MQLSVPSFEFPRVLPHSVRFIGALPIVPNQAPLPTWAPELDGGRKVVLVSQGTVANHDFGLLVAPTLAALADEPDLLVVVTAGGRPVEAIPGPIPANARLATYLPFEWLLPKVDVCVTNGGYGGVNQALSFGIPLVTAGLTEDKADVNVRVAFSGVGIDLATNTPTPAALRNAVRTVLDTQNYRLPRRAHGGRVRRHRHARRDPPDRRPCRTEPGTEYTAEDFKRLVSTNLDGFIYITQLAINQMLAQKSGGSIVSITASLADNPIAGVNASIPMITKGGINAITRSLAIEYAKDGIRVNAVAPGVVDTPLHRNNPKDFLKSLSPMGSISTVQEIVDAVIRTLRPHVGPANSSPNAPSSLPRKSLTIVGGRNAELPLECAIECGLEFVADVGGDLEDRLMGRLKLSRRKLQPPSRQIGQRWFAKKPCESLRHNSAGTARLGSQLCHSPRMGWLAV